MQRNTIYYYYCLLIIICLHIAHGSVAQNIYTIRLQDKKFENNFKGIRYGSFNPARHLCPVKEECDIASIPSSLHDIKILHTFLDREQYYFQSHKTGVINDQLFHRLLDFDTAGLTGKWVDNVLTMVLAKTTDEKDVLIIDANNDESFLNEKIIEVSYSDKPSVACNVTSEFFERGSIHQYTTSLQLSVDKLTDKIDWYWYKNTTSEGKLETDHKIFPMRLQTMPVYRIQDYNYLYIDINNDGVFGTDPHSGEAFKLNSVFKVNNKTFRVVELDCNGNSIRLSEAGEQTGSASAVSLGQQAPFFEEADITGIMRSLKDYEGKFLLLDFWGTWCVPCIKEMPYLKKAYKLYSKKLSILGVACNDDRQHVIDFITKNDIQWPQVLQKAEGKVPGLYSVFGFPTIFLISPDGKIISISEELTGENLLKTLSHYLD